MALYNTASGGQAVELTDQQFATLQQTQPGKYTAVGGTQAPTAQAPTALTSISSPAPAPTTTKAPSLPIPTAPQTQESYFLSAADQTKQARTSLEDAYKAQKERLDEQIAASELKMANLTSKQENVIEDDVQPLLEPFREDFEKSERDRLKVEENYFANQSLVNELEGLLTEGNNLIEQQKNLPIPQQILNKKVNKTISDVAARAGVIEAVMAARNNQIGQAYNLIDRSVAAMTADRTDQLNYYQTVLDFYQTAKNEEGTKLFKLEGEQEKLMIAQIGLLEGDLAQAEANAQHIKELMTTPETASFMAQAGVTLNDTPEVVNQKMAEQAQRQQVEDTKNEMIENGYEFVPYPTGDPREQTFSIGGKTMTFKAPAPKETGGGGGGVEDTSDRYAPEDEREIQRAGLINTEQRVKDIFVEAPAEFRATYIRNGFGNPDVTPEILLNNLEEWERATQGDDFENY